MTASQDPRRVLIADGETSDAAELEALLTRLGYQVAGVTASLADADLLAEEAEPHVALVDAALAEAGTGPDGGWGAVLGGRVPVLYTVGENDSERLRRVRAARPGGYLLKPFRESELRMGLAAVLEEERSAPAPAGGDFDFFDLSIDLLCCLGFHGYFVRLNPAWERVLGFTREELMSRPFIEFVHPDDRERTLQQNRAVRSGEPAHSFENRYVCKDGSYRWLMWNAAAAPARSTVYSVARDVTERRQIEQDLERLAATDELTGLWNRRGFTARAERELTRAARESAHLLLFYIDLDRFKEINDTYGHAEGDRVLVDVARMLQESCRGSDTVARLGGDEFALLALDEHGEGERIITERIRQALGRLNAANRHPYEVALTIGAVSVSPGETTDLHSLLTRADRRMYEQRARAAPPG
jgi:diguanylate cyclase (GGDEF)-like protein/PAS domain S-box-containing protein